MGNVTSDLIERTLQTTSTEATESGSPPLTSDDQSVLLTEELEKQLKDDPSKISTQSLELYRLLLQKQMDKQVSASAESAESRRDGRTGTPISLAELESRIRTSGKRISASDFNPPALGEPTLTKMAPKKKFLKVYQDDEDDSPVDTVPSGVEAPQGSLSAAAVNAGGMLLSPTNVSQHPATSKQIDASGVAVRNRSYTVSLPMRSRGPPAHSSESRAVAAAAAAAATGHGASKLGGHMPMAASSKAGPGYGSESRSFAEGTLQSSMEIGRSDKSGAHLIPATSKSYHLHQLADWQDQRDPNANAVQLKESLAHSAVVREEPTPGRQMLQSQYAQPRELHHRPSVGDGRIMQGSHSYAPPQAEKYVAYEYYQSADGSDADRIPDRAQVESMLPKTQSRSWQHQASVGNTDYPSDAGNDGPGWRAVQEQQTPMSRTSRGVESGWSQPARQQPAYHNQHHQLGVAGQTEMFQNIVEKQQFDPDAVSTMKYRRIEIPVSSAGAYHHATFAGLAEPPHGSSLADRKYIYQSSDVGQSRYQLAAKAQRSAYPMRRGSAEEMCDTVTRQQAHPEHIETIRSRSPPVPSGHVLPSLSNVINRSPYSGPTEKIGHMISLPLEPVEPSVRPRIAGLTHGDVIGYENLSGSHSKQQHKEDREYMQYLERSPHAGLGRLPSPAVIMNPPHGSNLPRYSNQQQQQHSQPGGRDQQPAAAHHTPGETPLDLTTHKEDRDMNEMTAVAFLRRVQEPQDKYRSLPRHDSSSQVVYTRQPMASLPIVESELKSMHGRQGDMGHPVERQVSLSAEQHQVYQHQWASQNAASKSLQPRHHDSGPPVDSRSAAVAVRNNPDWGAGKTLAMNRAIELHQQRQGHGQLMSESSHSSFGHGSHSQSDMQGYYAESGGHMGMPEEPRATGWERRVHANEMSHRNVPASSAMWDSQMAGQFGSVKAALAAGQQNALSRRSTMEGKMPPTSGQHVMLQERGSRQPSSASSLAGHHQMLAQAQLENSSLQSRPPHSAAQQHLPRNWHDAVSQQSGPTMSRREPMGRVATAFATDPNESDYRRMKAYEIESGRPVLCEPGSFAGDYSHASQSASPALPQLSPVPAGVNIAPPNRRRPAADMFGSAAARDILHVRCNVCTQTYGSPRSFRLHFVKQHGGEPCPEHFTIQRISETRAAMLRRESGEDSLMYLDDSLPPPALQRETGDHLPADPRYTTQVREIVVAPDQHRETMRSMPSQPQKQVAEVYPIPKRTSSPRLLATEPEATATIGDKPSPTDVNRTGSADENDEKSLLKCQKCEEFVANDWEAYRQHMKTHSLIDKELLMSETGDAGTSVDPHAGCAVCLEGFNNVADWQSHIATYHISSQHMMRSCTCKSCSKSFTNATLLHRHLAEVHKVAAPIAGGEIEVEYRCLFCSESFSDEHVLYAHTQAHEHRYSSHRRNSMWRNFTAGQRGSGAGGGGALGQCHVQTAVPDTTCPEDQRAYVDVPVAGTSKASSEDGRSSSCKSVRFDDDASPPAVSKVDPVPSASTPPRANSLKDKILRRLSATSGSETVAGNVKAASPGSDQGKNSDASSDEKPAHSDEEQKLKGKLFGNLIKMMRYEVELQLRSPSADTTAALDMAVASPEPEVPLLALSSASKKCMRDVCEAMIVNSFRSSPPQGQKSPPSSSAAASSAQSRGEPQKGSQQPNLSASVSPLTESMDGVPSAAAVASASKCSSDEHDADAAAAKAFGNPIENQSHLTTASESTGKSYCYSPVDDTKHPASDSEDQPKLCIDLNRRDSSDDEDNNDKGDGDSWSGLVRSGCRVEIEDINRPHANQSVACGDGGSPISAGNSKSWRKRRYAEACSESADSDATREPEVKRGSTSVDDADC